MSRKVSVEPVKRLTVELPESEYRVLEDYCLARQESKRQVIRSFIRRLRQRGKDKNQEPFDG
jgi:hypothetical protein